jgi:hypothetical protein
MPLKWIALAMIVSGIVAIVDATSMDGESSFENGKFLVEMVLGIGGIVCFVAGRLMMLAALFVAA